MRLLTGSRSISQGSGGSVKALHIDNPGVAECEQRLRTTTQPTMENVK